MFLDFMRGCTEIVFGYPIRYALEREHYKIKLHNPNTVREIEYEKFDYEIIKPNINPFADTLVNEMWPFFRMLWKARGGYSAEVYFNPDIDLREFGSQFGPGMYNAVYKFDIDDEGNWKADFDIKFDQVDNIFDDRKPPPEGRKGPFYAQDYSRMMSNTAKRARKLARPEWNVDNGRNEEEFWDLLEEERILNETTDFSFSYKFKESGSWNDYSQYRIEVPNQMRNSVIPEKENMKENLITIPINSIKKYVSK